MQDVRQDYSMSTSFLLSIRPTTSNDANTDILIYFDNVTSTNTVKFHTKTNKPITNTKNIYNIGEIIIYYGTNVDDVEKLNSILQKSSIVPDISDIQRMMSSSYHVLVSNQQTGISIVRYSVDVDKCLNLDLHYGSGMSEFHEDLLDYLTTGTCGLVILSGKTGTGKSMYVKNIIYDVRHSDIHKEILFIPSNYVELLSDPQILSTIADWSESFDNQTIIIIDNIDLTTPTGKSTMSMQNIGSLSDGLLFDLFGSQIIITTQTEISHIDKYYLRKNRLLAIKNFGTLSDDQINQFQNFYGIDFSNEFQQDTPITLADIYSLIGGKSILVHNIDKMGSNISMGFQ